MYPMSNLKQLEFNVFQAMSLLYVYNHDLYYSLRPPLERIEVKARLNVAGIEMPELEVMYSVHNGNYPNGERPYPIFSGGYFLSIEFAIDLCHKNKSLYEMDGFPIFSSLNGDDLIVDIDPQSNNYGMILIYSPSLFIAEPITIYDSIESCFKLIERGYESGIYSYKSGVLEVDYDREASLGKSLNPRSQYWK